MQLIVLSVPLYAVSFVHVWAPLVSGFFQGLSQKSKNSINANTIYDSVTLLTGICAFVVAWPFLFSSAKGLDDVVAGLLTAGIWWMIFFRDTRPSEVLRLLMDHPVRVLLISLVATAEEIIWRGYFTSTDFSGISEPLVPLWLIIGFISIHAHEISIQKFRFLSLLTIVLILNAFFWGLGSVIIVHIVNNLLIEARSNKVNSI